MIKPYLEALLRQIKKDNGLTDVYFNTKDYPIKDPRVVHHVKFNNKLNPTLTLVHTFSVIDSVYKLLLGLVNTVLSDGRIVIFSIMNISKKDNSMIMFYSVFHL